VVISPKLNGAKIKQMKEQDNNNDIPKFKRDSEIQVPKCKASATKETRNSEISDQIGDNVMDDRNTCRNDVDSTLRSVKVNEDEKHTIVVLGDSHFRGCTP
jgi:hypothetical protein